MLVVGAGALALPILAQTEGPAARPAALDAPSRIDFAAWRPVRRDSQTAEFEAEFPSAAPSGVPENDVVPLRIFIPGQATGPVPVVVVLHYWGATDLNLEIDQARELNKVGVAAVLLALPYHLARAPKGTRSGELALRPDVPSLIATMTQSVLDVRRTVDWVEGRPEFAPGRVGLVGTSLGAIVGALVHAVEPRVKATAFVLGGADLARILWSSSVVGRQRSALRQQGYTEERLRDELRSVEPLSRLRPDDPRPALLIDARYDTVVPPASADALAGALPRMARVRIDTGHYGGALVHSRLVRLTSRFFAATLNDLPFDAPRAFYAPTVRLMVTYNPETELQFGAGLDVWRGDARGDLFATALVTAQGLQGYVGRKLGRGFSAGVMITRRRTTWGVAWTVVL